MYLPRINPLHQNSFWPILILLVTGFAHTQHEQQGFDSLKNRGFFSPLSSKKLVRPPPDDSPSVGSKVSHCKKRDPKSPKSCLECHNHFYIKTSAQNQKVCESCSKDCIQCRGKNSCLSCIDQFYLYFGLCRPCSLGCLQCTDDMTCQRCAQYKYLKDGLCYSCPKGCNSCESPTLCSTCVSGYYKDQGVCRPCVMNCLMCHKAGQCLECEQDYKLKIDNSGVQTCQKPYSYSLIIWGSILGGVLVISLTVLLYIMIKRCSSQNKSQCLAVNFCEEEGAVAHHLEDSDEFFDLPQEKSIAFEVPDNENS